MKAFSLAFLILSLPSLAYAETDPTLINGRDVLPGEYPEVIKIRHGFSMCSATIVGERAVLTAGHCVADGGEIQYQLGQTQYKAKCKNTAKYVETEYHHDMAICKSDKPMDVRYAHIATEEVEVGKDVTLIGYGCQTPGGSDGRYGILKVGEAPVTRLPIDDYWYYTESTTTLCFGDSGGPSFSLVQKPKEEVHMVVGVNSRGNTRNLALLTAVYMQESLDFLSTFAKEQEIEICGLNSKCGLGNPEQSPEPEEEPKRSCLRKYRKMLKYLGKYNKYKEKFETCQAEE